MVEKEGLNFDHFLSCRSRLMAAVASIGPSVDTKVKSFSC